MTLQGPSWTTAQPTTPWQDVWAFFGSCEAVLASSLMRLPGPKNGL